MLNMTEIKGRINSIEQTRKITKAMQLISTVKMRKAMQKHDQNATYIDLLRGIIKDILLHRGDIAHPFLEIRKGNRTAFLVIAGDKGLAGPYNSNILNMALEHMRNVDEKYIFTVGHMATSFFNRKNHMVNVEFLHTAQNPGLHHARQIAEVLIDLYTQNHIDKIEILFTDMITSVTQEPKAFTLLPLELEYFADVDVETTFTGTYEYDPSPETVFDILVPQYIIGIIFSSLVESYACEQFSRMQAMDSATENADKMVSNLRKEYSRARQASVTNEMIEVANATNAVVGNL